jgi:GNAT superfamily N-acetyltransferase
MALNSLEKLRQKMTEIRALAPGDEAEWRALWTAYLAFYESEVSEEVYVSTFARLLSGASQEFRCKVAVQDGKLIGLVHFLSHRHCWRVENVIYLQDLYVDPSVRGTGAGRALIESVYAAGDADGTPMVYWLTQEFNATARKLYDRIGQVTPFIKYQRVL